MTRKNSYFIYKMEIILHNSNKVFKNQNYVFYI